MRGHGSNAPNGRSRLRDADGQPARGRPDSGRDATTGTDTAIGHLLEGSWLPPELRRRRRRGAAGSAPAQPDRRYAFLRAWRPARLTCPELSARVVGTALEAGEG